MAWLEGETLGQILKTVRKDWGRKTPGYLSQKRMALLLGKKHSGYAPSQGFISNIENDLNPIQDLHEAVRLDLLKLYPLSENQIEELNEQFNLDLPLRSEALHTSPNLLQIPRPLGNFVSIEVLQAQGGIAESHDDSRGEMRAKFVGVPEGILRGSRAADCALVEIFSDSMACDDVRLSIPEGSEVIVNRVDVPQSGDIIVADLFHEGEWRRILKIIDRTGHIILRSYNDQHEPIVLREGMELIKIGVYVNHTGPGRQAMRRLNKARLRM